MAGDRWAQSRKYARSVCAMKERLALVPALWLTVIWHVRRHHRAVGPFSVGDLSADGVSGGVIGSARGSGGRRVNPVELMRRFGQTATTSRLPLEQEKRKLLAQEIEDHTQVVEPVEN